jgi:ATP-dependent Clp protease adaptor protein ClpS
MSGSKEKPKDEVESLTQRKWKVVLYNDEDHTYDYVLELLTTVCKMSREQAFKCAVEVDITGRTIVWYGTLQSSQDICAQILQYGADYRLPRSLHSMDAGVEPIV